MNSLLKNIAIAVASLLVTLESFAADSAAIWKDSASGLMWTARDNGSDVDQRGASEYCARLQLDGYSGWRLPSNEDFATMGAAFSGQGHPMLERHEGQLWSSTMEKSNQAWVVNFDNANRSPRSTSLKLFRAICVRRTDQLVQAAESATLVITVDSPARVVVDGKLAGHLRAGESLSVPVASGTHEVVAINTQEGARVAQKVEMTGGRKSTITLPLAAAVGEVRRAREASAALDAQRAEEVRAAVAALKTRYQETPRRTVLDLKTKREWAGEGSSRSLSWQDATQYCATLSWGERSDWRLPTIAELEEMRRVVRAEKKYCCAAAPGIRLAGNSGILWSGANQNATQAWALNMWLPSQPGQLESAASSKGPSALCVRAVSN